MIKDFELKLSGKLPINREELFTLVDSWGRKESILTNDDLDIKNLLSRFLLFALST